MNPDVIVIGAGAIGTSIAYQLAKAGATVMIFERGRVGGAATGASAGMIQINPEFDMPEIQGPHVHALCRYPVKGLTPEPLVESLRLLRRYKHKRQLSLTSCGERVGESGS